MRLRQAVAASSLCLLPACGGVDSGPTTTPIPSGSAQVATYEGEPAGGDAAALEGNVTLISGCVFVQAGEGQKQTPLVLPVFPADAITESGGTVFFDNKPLRDGDSLRMAGGYRDQHALSWASIPSACQAVLNEKELMVFQLAKG